MMTPFLQTVTDIYVIITSLNDQAFPILLAYVEKHGKARRVGEEGKLGWRNPRVDHAPIIINKGVKPYEI